MDAGDAPLFRFPTAQGKTFHTASTSTSSFPGMDGTDLPDFLAMNRSGHGYDAVHPVLNPNGVAFDTLLDPAMLHGAYLPPSTVPAPQHSPLILSPTNELSMVFSPHQFGSAQNNQLGCPRSVPAINSANMMISPRGLHPLSRALLPESLQPSVDISEQKTIYPLEELDSDRIHGRGSVSSFGALPGTEPHYLSTDAMCQERIFRSSATPFGGSDVGSGCDEFDPDRDEPYAQRIYRCLKEAPNHTMVLKDIYKWFMENTDKGKDPNVKGWQNSIRHNLSMNKVIRLNSFVLGLVSHDLRRHSTRSSSLRTRTKRGASSGS